VRHVTHDARYGASEEAEHAICTHSPVDELHVWNGRARIHLTDPLDALNGQRCAVYWKDKPQARTEAQRKAGEKGRWWTATVTGVERVRNTLLLAVIYDAQDDAADGTADKLDVRQEHVVWLKE
jgi:hypothetical protein